MSPRAALARALLGAMLLVACEPARSFLLKFSGPTGPTDPEVARVARVDLELWDGHTCSCADLDQKPGCMIADRVGALAFSPSSGQRTAGGLPSGPLVLRVAAYDAAAVPISLKIDCWCVGTDATPTSGVLTLPLGSPRVPAGAGCPL